MPRVFRTAPPPTTCIPSIRSACILVVELAERGVAEVASWLPVAWSYRGVATSARETRAASQSYTGWRDGLGCSRGSLMALERRWAENLDDCKNRSSSIYTPLPFALLSVVPPPVQVFEVDARDRRRCMYLVRSPPARRSQQKRTPGQRGRTAMLRDVRRRASLRCNRRRTCRPEDKESARARGCARGAKLTFGRFLKV